MKKILFVIFLAVFLAILIAETAIRLTDIPGIDKNIYYTIDPLMGYGYIPYAKLYYCNARGDVVRRNFNAFGYLDRGHKKEKDAGVYRIGFFGDSYVEAGQVGLEHTFFRIIENELKDYNVECLAFGRESAGTLIAYLDSTRWSPYFDIDLIIYVFCENDPGDNIKEIKEKTAPYFPFAYLAPNGYKIDYSNRDKFIRLSKTSRYKIRKYLSNRLLLTRVIKNRIALLMNYGIKFKVNQEDRNMATKSKSKSIVPDQNDMPSTWPGPLKEYAEELASAIILKWTGEAQAGSKNFAILYVPRQTEMQKETHLQDSWKVWLESFCGNNNTAFIDPTRDLIKMESADKKVFYDHFTIHGHQAFSDAFIGWFKKEFSINKSIL